MHDYLPSMQALRSFESVARLSSISKAATQLCVTQGAVSKQIKILESFLNLALFTRSARGLHLTPEGRKYLGVVSKSLNELNSIGEALQCTPKKQSLLVDMIPSMSNLWLIPKIHRFEQRFRHLQVDLINGDGPPDFQQSQADVYVRCLLEKQAKGHTVELFKEELLLVACADLLLTKPITKPLDIMAHRLLQQNTRPQMWQHFLNRQAGNIKLSELRLGMSFQHFFMSIKAAEEGLGLALIPDFLARDSIAQGKLINPLGLKIESSYAYYIFNPSYKAQLRKTQEFNQWLLAELKDSPR